MGRVHVEVEDDDGRLLRLVIRRPTHAILRRACRVLRQAYRDAVDAGLTTDADVEERRNAQDDWSARVEELKRAIKAGEGELACPKLPLTHRISIAISLRKHRAALFELSKPGEAADAAAQARFEFLVARCVTYRASGRPVFRDADHYRARASEPFGYRVAAAVARVLYGVQEFPEERLLREHPVTTAA